MVDMEIDQNPDEMAKKLWNVVRVFFYMLRKGLSKSKLMSERSKLAGKSLTKFHLISAVSCRSTDVANSIVYPREYQFSFNNRRKHFLKPYHHDDIIAVQRVFEIPSSEKMEGSPLITLPGFGKLSPLVRKLRITDSPFPLKDEGDSQVDKAAEDFIKNFHKNLKLQKTMASFESPYSDRFIWSR